MGSAVPVTALIDDAVASGRIPGAVLAAGLGDAEPAVLHVAGDAQHDEDARRPMSADTIFDLASLTKVVGTLPCVLRLIAAGEVGLDDRVDRYLPAFTGAGKDLVLVRHLLTHTSGLPAHRPYYAFLSDPEQVRGAALAEPLLTAPGGAACYSDIGFITAGELCAAVAGCGLEELVTEMVAGPLGLSDTGYRPSPALARRIASTEPVGDAPAKTGIVHDENAEALGGVAGHAGLFGTAADLGRYAAAWAAADSGAAEALGLPAWLRTEALRCQTEGLSCLMPGEPNSPGRRGLGWGLRGDRFDNMGAGWPETGAGHTGFTGTSLSFDPVSGLWAVLLTNAVHFGRAPEHSVVGLRKQVHAMIGAMLANSVVQ
jgi:CubicO group peptidase (beta-lactamase class C family)